jgi:hypothetical protein
VLDSCFLLCCCTAKFRSSGGTYELPCTSKHYGSELVIIMA